MLKLVVYRYACNLKLAYGIFKLMCIESLIDSAIRGMHAADRPAAGCSEGPGQIRVGGFPSDAVLHRVRSARAHILLVCYVVPAHYRIRTFHSIRPGYVED